MNWVNRFAGRLAGALLMTALLAAAAPVTAAPPPAAPHSENRAKPVTAPLGTPRTVTLRREVAGAFTLYHLPEGKPWSVAKAGDGSLWFTLEEPAGLLHLNPQHPGTAQFYATPAGLHPYMVNAGAGSTVWFTDFVLTQHPGPGHLVQVDAGAGVFRIYATPTDAGPAAAAMAPDGSLWFTEFLAGGYGRLDPAAGTLTEWLLPPAPGQQQTLPFGIHPAGTGAWVAESGTDSLVQIRMPGLAERIPMPDQLWGPTDVQQTVGGDLFISPHGSNDVLQITADGTRYIHGLHAPEGVPGVANPSGIVLTPAGAWVAEHVGNRLALIRPDGNVVEFAEPQAETWAQWLQVTGGGVWYAGYHHGTIGFLPETAVPGVQVDAENGTALRQGGQTKLPLTAALPAGTPGPVTVDLHVDRLPAGVTATVEPNRVTLAPGQSVPATVTLAAQNGAARGETRLLLTAALGGDRQVQVSRTHVLTVQAGYLGFAWTFWGVMLALVLLAAAITVRLVALRRR